MAHSAQFPCQIILSNTQHTARNKKYPNKIEKSVIRYLQGPLKLFLAFFITAESLSNANIITVQYVPPLFLLGLYK